MDVFLFEADVRRDYILLAQNTFAEATPAWSWLERRMRRSMTTPVLSFEKNEPILEIRLDYFVRVVARLQVYGRECTSHAAARLPLTSSKLTVSTRRVAASFKLVSVSTSMPILPWASVLLPCRFVVAGRCSCLLSMFQEAFVSSRRRDFTLLFSCLIMVEFSLRIMKSGKYKRLCGM